MKVPFFVAAFVITLGSFSSLPAQQLLDGIVGYWPLDEGAGDVANDSFGDVQDVGELRNEPQWLTGEDAFLGNGSLFFEGVDAQQDVLIPNSSDLNFTTNGATVSAWVNTVLLPSELPEAFGGIFDSEQDTYIMYLDRGNEELRVKFTTSNGIAERPGIPESMLQTEEWIHVAGVYDGDQKSASIYLNGELIDTHDNAGFGQPLASGQVVTIGANAAPDGAPGGSFRFFEGTIDDVAVWNRAITKDEVEDIYLNGLSGFGLLRPPGDSGDFNLDGTIDIADFNIMVEGFNMKFPFEEAYSHGDIDFNGRVEMRDFVAFRELFHDQQVAASVPEPDTLSCLLVIGLLRVGQRRRSSS